MRDIECHACDQFSFIPALFQTGILLYNMKCKYVAYICTSVRKHFMKKKSTFYTFDHMCNMK